MLGCNYHTHTRYCDGKDTPEELVLRAIELGCPELGFSGHWITDFDSSYCMTREGARAYRAEIEALRVKYRDKIRILLGVETDFYSEPLDGHFDYVIGSVHYLRCGDRYMPVDSCIEDVQNAVRDYFHGDIYAYCEAYYDLVAQVVEKTHCDIVGHFDLVTKMNEGNRLFDTQHPRYRAAAFRALEAVEKHDVVFELNTGAIARGYRTEPYPARDILDKLIADSGKICFSSDCHNRDFLLCGLEQFGKYCNI